VDPKELTLRFNDCINGADVDGLEALMTEDHTFIDTAGDAVHGRSACVQAWRGFFESFPGYRNDFESVEERGGRVVVLGTSSCTDPRLTGPAMWVAVVCGGQIAEWRVLDDTKENREAMGVGASRRDP
jgi:ketosteroid isomerase-like protein